MEAKNVAVQGLKLWTRHAMATTQKDQGPAQKTSVEHIDTISVVEPSLKPTQHVELDKFGAAEKSDPAEIALVRKIDVYLLPILWLMYCEYSFDTTSC